MSTKEAEESESAQIVSIAPNNNNEHPRLWLQGSLNAHKGAANTSLIKPFRAQAHSVHKKI